MLKDIKTLKEVSQEYNIPLDTLQYRLRWLEEGEHYRKLGVGQSTILSKKGVKKIVRGKENIKEDN